MDYSIVSDLSSSIYAARTNISNDKIPTCKVCHENGFHYEPIIFLPLEGGGWLVVVYFKPWKRHLHKLPIRLWLRQTVADSAEANRREK